MCELKNMLLGLALSIVLLGVAGDARAQVTSEESAVKAAFVFNILKFVEWQAPFVRGGTVLSVCMWGEDSLDGALEVLDEKQIGDWTIAVDNVSRGQSPMPCDVIYVGNGVSREAAALRDAVTSPNHLTISDDRGFLSRGGMVEFYRANDRVRFRINEPALNSKKYTIGSRLLEFAR